MSKYVAEAGYLPMHIAAIDESESASTAAIDTQYALGYARALLDLRQISLAEHDAQRAVILERQADRLRRLADESSSS